MPDLVLKHLAVSLIALAVKAYGHVFHQYRINNRIVFLVDEGGQHIGSDTLLGRSFFKHFFGNSKEQLCLDIL